MDSYTASALPLKYATAFSFPLCYATSDANSDGESSTTTTTSSRTSEKRTVGNNYHTFTDSCSNVISKAHLLRCITTSSRRPPPKFGNLVTPDGLCTKAKAMHSLNVQEEDYNVAIRSNIGRAATAPPIHPQFTQSCCTSAISSFSSESLPVLLTSSQSQESTDYGSSHLGSDVTDFERSPWVEEASDGSTSTNLSPKSEEVLSSTGKNSMGVAKTKLTDPFSEDNLVNNSELTVSLESVLTVVPLPQNHDVCTAPNPRQTENLRFPAKPRNSTSSFGDVSIQSWDSHLGSDSVIDDIVENVIHDLTLYDCDLKNWDGTLHPDDSHISERKASPASLSSYASSRRLEWDNGADIGYTKVPSRTGYHGQSVCNVLSQSEVEGHSQESSTYYNSLQRDEGCFTCPKHFNEAMSQIISSSCDVTVQTDESCKKDAEVQAQTTFPKPLQRERFEAGMICSPSLDVTGSVHAKSNGASSDTFSTAVSHCTSLLNNAYKPSNFGLKKSSPSNNDANLGKDTLTCDSSQASIKQCEQSDGGSVPKDCARSVALCYSQRFSSEFENILNLEVGGDAVSKSSVSSSDNMNAVKTNSLSASGRRCSRRILPLTHLGSIDSSHLRMQMPVKLGSLTSGTDSPAEVPRANSEGSKRRLDHWLNCGFPYVPTVAPLKAETRTNVFPKLESVCNTPRAIQLPATDIRTFPQLMKISSSCVEVPKVQLQEPLTTTHVSTRKRYITRCKTSHVERRESLYYSDGSRRLLAVTKGAPTEGNMQAHEPVAAHGLQHVQSQVPVKPTCTTTVPFVIREKSDRCIAKLRKGRLRRRPMSRVADCSETEDFSEQTSSGKQEDSEDGNTDGEAVLSCSRAVPDTSSVSSCNSRGRQCHLKRVAHRELERLHMLVDKQRHSYLKRLQKEVNRLQKLEALFAKEQDKQSVLPHTAPVVGRFGPSSLRAQAPYIKSRNCGVSATSSGIYKETPSEPERYFVTIATSPKKTQKQQQTSKTAGASWVVPLLPTAANQEKSTAVNVEEKIQQLKSFSLQAAFAEKCKHIIKHSQERLSRVAALAERRSRRRAIFPAASRELKSTVLHKEGSHRVVLGVPRPRALYTHREMREQTEKVYNKLPEVIQMKEKLSREQQYRRNRQAVQTYNKVLQDHALRGCINFALDRPCIKL